MITKSRIRAAKSIFLLGIFVSFYSLKDIHDIQHAGDFHCHVQGEQHFHQMEHHCALCDFNYPSFNDTHQKPFSGKFVKFIKFIKSPVTSLISPDELYNTSPRAPPTSA